MKIQTCRCFCFCQILTFLYSALRPCSIKCTEQLNDARLTIGLTLDWICSTVATTPGTWTHSESKWSLRFPRGTSRVVLSGLSLCRQTHTVSVMKATWGMWHKRLLLGPMCPTSVICTDPPRKVKQHREQILGRHKPWHWPNGFRGQTLKQPSSGWNNRNTTNYTLYDNQIWYKLQPFYFWTFHSFLSYIKKHIFTIRLHVNRPVSKFYQIYRDILSNLKKTLRKPLTQPKQTGYSGRQPDWCLVGCTWNQVGL